MKKLLYIILLLPLWVNAQTNGTIQKTSATGTIRGSFGSLGLDTLVNVNAPTNGFVPVYNSTLKKSIWTNPSTFSPTLGTSAISLGGTANGLSYSAGNYRLHKVTATTGGVLTTGADTIAGSKTFSSIITIPDEAYDAAWNGKLQPPTKNAVWDALNGAYVPYTGASADVNLGSNSLRADSLIKSGGTSAQFLKADGSVDANTYLTTTGSGSGLSGVVLTSTNQTGIAGDKSWTGTQTISNNVDVTYGTTGLAAIQATSTNAGGMALAALANSTLEPFAVTQQGSGKLAVFNNNATEYAVIRNNGSIYTRGQLEVGNLLVGDAADSVMVHRAIDLTVRRVPTTGTGSAVFNTSPSITTPTFTTSATVDAGTNDIKFGAISNYGYASFNGSTSLTGMLGMFGGASGDANNLYLQVPSTGTLDFRVDNLDAMIVNSSGDLTIAGNNATKASGTAWINPSDLRLKMNVGDYSKGLAEVLQIKPKTWYFNKASGFDQTKKHLSPIAQELKLIMPEMVSTYKGKLNGKEQELLQVDASDMTWLLVKAIQEQQAIIEKLNQRITLLEQKP